jgi:hypothetical protein
MFYVAGIVILGDVNKAQINTTCRQNTFAYVANAFEFVAFYRFITRRQDKLITLPWPPGCAS